MPISEEKEILLQELGKLGSRLEESRKTWSLYSNKSVPDFFQKILFERTNEATEERKWSIKINSNETIYMPDDVYAQFVQLLISGLPVLQGDLEQQVIDKEAELALLNAQ